MTFDRKGVRLALFLGMSVATLVANKSVPAGEPVKFAQVKAMVERHLSADSTYLPGDLISRRHVEPIFDELLELGVQPSDNREDLYDAILPENALLVEFLQSTAGTEFMRHVASTPGAYDRLERLSWMADGRQLLRALIASPEGPAAFKKMCTEDGSTAIAEQFADDPRIANFGRPTGHIHTADQLLRRLETIVSRHNSK